MKSVDIHRAWAPPDGLWTPWVKPVLFADDSRAYARRLDALGHEMPHLPEWFRDEVLEPLGDRSSAHAYRQEPKRGDVALVLDLPSATGTELGVALTTHGFRPIPLYNALPGPRAIVNVAPIIEALEHGAPYVADVSTLAPPAFLLDANRSGAAGWDSPALFDNRSLCRAADFPSVETFRQAGIRRIAIVSDGIQSDLLAIAVEWQRGGLEVWSKDASAPTPVARVELRAPWFGRRLWTTVRERWWKRDSGGVYGTMIVPALRDDGPGSG